MGNFLKVFGVICGILTFFFCACSGHAIVMAKELDSAFYNSFGFFVIGMAFFTGPLLIVISLKCGHPVSGGGQKPTSRKPIAKPAKNSKQAAKKAPAKRTDGKSEDDLTIIYVGNLSPEANEAVLQTAFSGFGEIKKIKIIKDRGRPKGFGFVEMLGKDEAQAAIEAMNGKELAGRPLKVNEAKPKTNGRPQRSEKKIDDEPMRPNIFE